MHIYKYVCVCLCVCTHTDICIYICGCGQGKDTILNLTILTYFEIRHFFKLPFWLYKYCHEGMPAQVSRPSLPALLFHSGSPAPTGLLFWAEEPARPPSWGPHFSQSLSEPRPLSTKLHGRSPQTSAQTRPPPEFVSPAVSPALAALLLLPGPLWCGPFSLVRLKLPEDSWALSVH